MPTETRTARQLAAIAARSRKATSTEPQQATMNATLTAIQAEIAALGGGTVSAGNSTATPLGIAGVFTGAWEDVSAYDSVTVAPFADQNGTYSIQFSADGTNVDSTLTRYYRTALINPPHRFTITRQYARVVFTNGSVAQTTFRLQTLYGNKAALNVPLGGSVSLDYDATITRSPDYHHDVSRGLWQGRTNWQKWGYNLDVDSGAAEPIWPNGAAFGPSTIPTTATTFTFVSDSTDDDGDPVGIGARTLIVYYNDANGLPATGIITMDGTTNVVSAFSGLGINRVAVLSAGSNYTNVGNITVTYTTGGAQAAYVPAGDGVTQQCMFFVPWGYDAQINKIRINANKISGGGSPRVTVDLFTFNVQTTQVLYRLGSQLIDVDVENTVEFDLGNQPLALSSSDVFWMRATTSVDNTGLSARFTLTTNRILST